MKTLCSSMFLMLLFVGCDRSRPPESIHNVDVLPSDLTTEEQALLDDVRKMFQKNDITPLTARFQEGSTEWGSEIHRSFLEGILAEGLGWMELIRIHPPEREKRERDGSVFKWSLPLKWKLIIYLPSDGSMTKTSHTLSFSEHEGRIVYVFEGSSVEQNAAGQPATPP